MCKVGFSIWKIILVIFINIIILVTCRQYYNSKEELELTKSVPLINVEPCVDSETVVIFIPSAAHISGKYYDKRQAVRQTWAFEARTQFNISTYFVIALNINETINERLESEAKQHGDMIQFNFIDDYYNFTLKMVSILRWADRYCSGTKFVVKSDDDVIINAKRLTQMSDSFETGITGHVVKERPNRSHASKQCIPQQYYSEDWLPEYVYGGSYVISTDIIGKLLNTVDNYTNYVLDIEDVFITGVIAEQSGVGRHRSQEFAFGKSCTSDKCNLCTMSMVVAYVECLSANQTLEFYNNWKSFDNKSNCFPYCHSSHSSMYKNSLLLSIILYMTTKFIS